MLPKPKAGEKKEQFINRCMGDDVSVKEYPDIKQRYAVCIGCWLDKYSSTIGKFWYKKGQRKAAQLFNEIKSKFAITKISIDFDDTLSTPKGQELAKKLIKEGNDVHVVTRRRPNMNREVESVARMVGIPINKIHYTSGQLKWKLLKQLGIKEHIDNNPDEIKAIQENTDIKAIKFSEIK